jgi:hypothetical protein
MSATVAARHRLDELMPTLEDLRTDPTTRVAAAAGRAIVRIVGVPS